MSIGGAIGVQQAGTTSSPPSDYPSPVGLPLPGDQEVLAAFNLNVSRMLASAKDMSWGFLALVHAVFGAREINSAARELIGLRVAKLLAVTYQWQQHAAMARNAGLPAAVIGELADDGGRRSGLPPISCCSSLRRTS